MDSAYLSALAALAGSAIGGATSFLSSWLSHGAQLRSQLVLYDKGRRQELYREFVDEASRLYIDALVRDTPDLSKTINLYALIRSQRKKSIKLIPRELISSENLAKGAAR